MEKKSFADLGVSSAVAGALSRRGIEEPFEVQRLVLGDVLDGRDVLVKSPTGSGKTLAFGIPLAERINPSDPAPAALVLAPTRELASQIVEELRDITQARKLKIAAVYGGVGLVAQSARAARAQILVATPGRLEDLLARRAFTLDAIRILVLDEADRMLDMGFRPAIDRIVKACPSKRQTLFFSATLDGIAGNLAASYTKDAVKRENGTPGKSAAERVEHRFVAVRDDSRIDALLTELGNERDRALVFVRTKRGADRLVKRLGANGVEALAIHGNKSQRQREQALARFRSGRIDTLVATDVAARGIDVEGISHVINFDPPEDHDTYVHRIGRTGRAGRTGVGVTLVGAGEHQEMRKLAGRLGVSHELGGGGERQGRPAAVAPGRGGASGAPGRGGASGRGRGHRGRRPAARA
ncbi:MAG TPA: DEAD/DEAH box helicase [Solirubrobacteraceae bacterium]|jgi:ATP-dependent RNA helicase RhlE|nr:DEAD/DEAH box helicase [Solirubrobacteraceae bacterium]